MISFVFKVLLLGIAGFYFYKVLISPQSKQNHTNPKNNNRNKNINTDGLDIQDADYTEIDKKD